MTNYSRTDRKLKFRVQVVPRASRSEIVGEHDGTLRIRIAAPPVEGAANAELIKVLAKKFGVAKSNVEIVSGHSSRVKHVVVSGTDFSLCDVVK